MSPHAPPDPLGYRIHEGPRGIRVNSTLFKADSVSDTQYSMSGEESKPLISPGISLYHWLQLPLCNLYSVFRLGSPQFSIFGPSDGNLKHDLRCY